MISIARVGAGYVGSGTGVGATGFWLSPHDAAITMAAISAAAM